MNKKRDKLKAARRRLVDKMKAKRRAIIAKRKEQTDE